MPRIYIHLTTQDRAVIMTMRDGQRSIRCIAKRPKRGRFSTLFKRELVLQTLRSDVSVAGVARTNGINANLLAPLQHNYLIVQADKH